MKLVTATAALAVLLISPVYGADCVAPGDAPTVPDGNTASVQEMVASQKAVMAYNQTTNAYLDCLKQAHDAAVAAAGPSIKPDQKRQLDKDEMQKHNAAVDKLNAVAGHFNEQVRIFKAKNAAPPAKPSGTADPNKGN